MSREKPQDSVMDRLSPNALEVLRRRYLRRGPDGKPAETVEGMFRRVAHHIAAVETAWNGDVQVTEEIFYDLLTSLRFVPNSPTFTGAGTPLGQLAACFVLPVSDDMGRRDDGIFQTLRNMALIHQTGGGTGFSFSRLRPKETVVISSGGKATGPVGFMRVYDLACEIISQGGTRRGANMGVLRVDHPDIEEFITCKTDEHAINNFNISVGVTDAFMQAVENDEEWELRFPDVLHPAYRTFNGTLEEAGRVGIPIQVYRKVRARDLFDKIVRQAHRNGEPGILFLDAMNRSNPCPHLGAYEATNPCLAGDTWVVTDRGPAQVKQLIGVPVSLLVNGRFHPTSAEGFFCTGKRETLEIRTRRGFRLTVTPEHPLRVVTRMTRYAVESAWRRAGDLKIGDRVLLGEHRDATWAGRGTWEEGYLLGLLVGDGTFADSRAVISVWGEGPGPEAIRQKVESILSHFPHRADFQGFARIPERGEYRLRSRALYDLARAYGLSGESKGITPEIEQTSSDFHVGFLCGLFDTDGTVLGSQRKGLSVRLAQSDLSMLEAVQRMLHRLGIVSTIYQNRRKGRTSLLPGGRGGVRLYPVRPQHELVISGENLAWFAQRVGFVHEEKAARLRQGLEAYRRRMNRERFVDEVVAIEPRGENRVYDARVPGIHAFDANGFYVHNCGEQPLLPYENCCLGSINLARHVVQSDGSARIDWGLLQKTVEQAVRFLDDVVDANAYVPAIPQLKEAAQRTRRIGLGIMALGDVMYMLGVRYGSEEAQELASQMMEFIRYHAMRASIALARERGPFPAIRGSVYDPEDLRWTPPTPLVPYTRLEKWGRPPLDWEEILDGIRQYGIRNAAQLTVAPTGTIATIAGCEAYGCEPVYALAYTRKVHDEGREIELRYVSQLFLQVLERAGIDEPTRERILEQVLFTGSCQDVPEVPPEIRHVFVVAGDITAEEHVRMQAALQAFVDAAISKTINFPADATPEDVARAYMLAWKLGCKGLTVYVTGSREKVVLETEAVRKAREAQTGAPTGALAGTSPTTSSLMPIRPRPHILQGQTYRINTPLGTAYVTVNCNGEGEPFEVFLNVGKAGSDTAAVAEAIGRLISLVLRVPSPLPARRRLQQVVKQLRGIGGGRPTGFGRDRVQSLPDGVAQVLAEFLGLEAPPEHEAGTAQLPLFPLGDLCPECGHATLVSEEGCRRCYACGYSEC